MVKACAAFGCTNRFGSCGGLTLHRFPKNPERRKLWGDAVRRKCWKAKDTDYLCSRHFDEIMFDRTRQTTRLRENAVPSVFPEFPSYYQKKGKPRRPITRICNAPASTSHSSSDLPDAACTSLAQVVGVKIISQRETIVTTPEKSTNTDAVVATNTSNGNTELYVPQLGNQKTVSSSCKEVQVEPELSENTPRKQAVKRKLEDAMRSLQEKKKKIKSLHQKKRRLQKKCLSLKQCISELKEKKLISEQALDVLQSTIPPDIYELVRRMVRKERKTYTPLLRSFAMTLHFYSPAAYRFVRNKFHLALPSPRTLSGWYSSVNAEPGFTGESFEALCSIVAAESTKGERVSGCLVIDDMSIRKHLSYDGHKTTGFVDIGTGADSDDLPLAKEACVLMLVLMKKHLKIPLGYFLISSLSSSERASLVRECLCKLYDVGVDVHALTFDGTSSNISMGEQLGAQLLVDDPVTHFDHPRDLSKKVYIILDASHMIKLIRNCLGEKILPNGNGSVIDWNFIQKLVKIQENEGLFIANKLTKSHIAWKNHKMKVKLATQVLSKSVADALIFCEKHLHFPEFRGAEATAEFITIFDTLFDVMNSHSKYGKNFKAPIKKENECQWRPIFTKAEKYIKALKIMENLGNGRVSERYVCKSQRKTGFLSFLINMKSIVCLYESLVHTKLFEYILTYKLSQDHLETFFRAIRQKCGWNNNPSARAFKSAYRSLLLHIEIAPSSSSNCIFPYQPKCLYASSRSVKKVAAEEYNEERLQNLFSTYSDHNYSCAHSSYQELSKYVDHVVQYIAGYVSKKIMYVVTCAQCKEALYSNNSKDVPLVHLKSRGWLTTPSADVVKICKLTEQCLRMAKMNSGNYENLSKQKKVIILKVLNDSVMLKCFETLRDHVLELGPFDSHIHDLIKIIAESYLNIRIYHETKKINMNISEHGIRNKLTRTVIFKNL